MADNYTATPGTGVTFGSDEVSAVQYPRIKLVWGVEGAVADASATNPLPIIGNSTRVQTPSGAVMQVQIGPGDPISNTPVIMDFDQHQIHEGEGHRALYDGTALGTGTVKFGITVATYNPTIAGPHMSIIPSVYNGSVLVTLYETATFTGGSLMTRNNKNRNVAVTDTTTITSGVTSTNGTLIDAFYVGAGGKSTASALGRDEWVLKSNTIYRVDVIGQVAGTAAYVVFDYYCDLGV